MDGSARIFGFICILQWTIEPLADDWRLQALICGYGLPAIRIGAQIAESGRGLKIVETQGTRSH